MIKRLTAALLLSISTTIFSQLALAEPEGQPEEEGLTLEQFMASLNFQKGKVTLPNNIATLDLSESFQYLSPEDAERVLVDAWGNPPGNETLGMILPADFNPEDANTWGVVITYDADGYVKDDDADSIDYDDLLKDMQEETAANNETRKEEGYGTIDLIGWAEKPVYDKQSHKMYWAKELQFDGGADHTLNYNIRVLGREGVLVLNAIAGMNQLAQIKQEMQDVVQFTEFTPGNTYADFNSSTDKVAEYGLAALVAGGVATKLGFFGKLLALLVAFKKLILIGLVAVGAAIAKMFGRNKAE